KKGFGELGQRFFGTFVARFLNFYLSRVTAATLGSRGLRDLADLTEFNRSLRMHCNQSARIVRDFCGEWRWRLTSVAARWPKSVPVTPAKPDERVSGLRITMAGHASTLIQVASVNILTDPVWSERAGPFSFVGPKRVTKPGINFDDLPPI